MRYSQFRQNIKSWLEGKVRVDDWDLDNPPIQPAVIDGVAYPANRVIELPITDIKWQPSFQRIWFTLRYDINYRFRQREYDYHQLPIVDLEVAGISLGHQLRESIGEISEGSATIDDEFENSDPLMLTVTESNQDWIATLTLAFRVSLNYEFEEVPSTLQPSVLSVPAVNIDTVELKGYTRGTLAYTETINE